MTNFAHRDVGLGELQITRTRDHTMPYVIALSEDERYLRVRIDAPVTRALASTIGRDLKAAGTAHGVSRFLYDVRDAPNIESVFGNYGFAYQNMSEVEASRVARHAILVRADDRSHDFVETLLRNAGYDARLFRSEEEAVAWLCE